MQLTDTDPLPRIERIPEKSIRSKTEAFAFAVGLALSSPAVADPFQDACDSLGGGIEIVIEKIPMPRISAKPLTELNGISARLKWMPEYSWGLTDIAWTLPKWDNGIAYEMSSISRKNGESCLRPNMIITLGLRDIDIAIAKEIRMDSCLYRETIGHEMKHVSLYGSVLEEAGKAIRSSVEKEMSGKTFRGKDRNEAIAKAVGYLDSRIGEIVVREIEIRTKSIQDSVDTLDEYERMSDVCDGEAQKILRSTWRK